MLEELVATTPLIVAGMLGAVTYDDWFFAPDGDQYRTAFGPITIHKAKSLFGFEPKNSANWYVQIGYGEKAILLAGCRIHAAMLTLALPKGKHVYDAR